MTPDTLFQISNPMAALGWALLAFAPFMPRFADRVAGYFIPALFSLGYTVVLLVHWWSAEGGFDTLPNVMLLLSNPWTALAGWVHYLAFDLVVGAWITRTARTEGIPHLLILPILALTFLVGPMGFLAFLGLRAARTATLTPKET